MGFSFQENENLFSSFSPLYEVAIYPIIKYSFIHRIIAGALVFWQCVLINKIVVSQGILSTNSFFPAFFYFLIISISPQSTHLSPALLSITFILLSLNKILSTYLSNSAHIKIFDSSLLMSIAVLIHPPFLILTPIIWIGMSVFSQVNWRLGVVNAIGLISPWYLLYTYGQYFSIDKLNISSFFDFMFEDNKVSTMDTGDLISFVCFGVISLLAVTELVFSLKRKNIKARKSYILLLLALILILTYSILSPDNNHIKLLILALPLSTIISNYFYYQRQTRWLNIIAYCLFICLIINHYVW
jgi:hypothetical protein